MTGYHRPTMTDQLSLRLEPERPVLPGLPDLRPMLPRPLAEPFDSDQHLFQPWWGGRRALVYLGPAELAGGGIVRIVDEEGADLTRHLRELAGLAVRVDARSAVLDGKWVLSDRFVDSSLAYQGGAGGLGIEAVRAINAFGIEEWFPDRTLVLALAEGGARARARDNETSDRIGGRPENYHQKVDLAFRQIAVEEPERVRIIDASGVPPEVTARLLEALADLLP